MTDLTQRLEEICREHEVIALYIFGSRADQALELVRNGAPFPEAHGSDLDVGVLPAPGAVSDPRSAARLAAALEDLLGVKRVDLVVLPRAPAFLALEVVRGELIVDLAPDRTAEYELFVLRRAGDLLPFERMRRDAILNGRAV